MKLLSCILCLSAAGTLALSSCAKQETESTTKYEDQALEAWMTQNRKELLKNKQTPGDYYVEVLEAGDQTTDPLNKSDDSWVAFDFSGRDLAGNIIQTRRAKEAYQLGTFTKYTHYSPYYRYCGKENLGLMEGTYLAMRNKLRLDPDYAAEHGLPEEFEMRQGSKVVLYMPSRVVGGVSGSGGYEGQYSLNSNRPFIVTMEVRDTVKNPLQREGSDVDTFGEKNGKVQVFDKKDNPIPTDPADVRHPYNVASPRWSSATDSIPQLYVNYRFDPKADRFTYPNPYNVGIPPYDQSDLVALEEQISAALVKRFHSKEEYKGVAALTSDSVKLDGTASIWYIGRFLDGFIFDTNIDEVKKIIYGTAQSAGEALSYKPEEGGLISAFYYAVPHLRYGQWATLITTSTNAYGSSGKAGGSSTSSSGNNGYSSGYADYMNYMNYANSYYGNNGYYGGYYGNYYDNYYGGYYDPYYGSSYNSSSTGQTPSVTTVNTEIPSFAPLVFEFYIEPKK